MVGRLRRIGVAPRLPGRITAVAALFAGWGVFHLVAALLNAGSSTTFFIEWFAFLGLLLVFSGRVLYRRHRFGVSVGLVTLGVLLVSNVYNTVVYHGGVDAAYLGMEIAIKAGLAFVLATIARDQRTDGGTS